MWSTSLLTTRILTGSISLLLVALMTIPAIYSIVLRFVLRKHKIGYQSLGELYQDKDGSATVASVEAFSGSIQRWSIAGCSIIGFLLALALAVFGTVTSSSSDIPSTELWLQVGIWVGLQ
jgi:hypothetical protein